MFSDMRGALICRFESRWVRRRNLLALLLLMGNVWAEPADGVEVIAAESQPWYEAADRAVARELASPRNSSAERLSIAEIIVPAGVEVRPHHHLMEEIYHVVSGEGVMMVEDAERVVRAGDTVVIRPHQWHNIANRTSEELRLVVTCVPAWAPEHLIFDRQVMPGTDGGQSGKTEG